MKKLIWLALLLPLTVLYTTGANALPSGKPFVEINGQIAEVQGIVESLEDRFNAIVGRIDSLEDRVLVAESAIISLQFQADALQSQIDMFGNDLFAIQTTIDGLIFDNVNLQAQIDANSGNIVTLQTQVDTNSGLISQLQQVVSGLSTLEEQIIDNTLLIAQLQIDIDEVNTFLTLKQNIIDGVCIGNTAIHSIQTDGSIVCIQVGGATGIELVTVSRFTPGEVFCPDGYTIVSGGVFLSGGNLRWSRIGDGNSWTGGKNGGGFMIVDANCMKLVN